MEATRRSSVRRAEVPFNLSGLWLAGLPIDPDPSGDEIMNARKVAAQFAAYAWYEETRAGKESPAETARFAREHWAAFLPVASEGWGRLLLRIASPRTNHRHQRLKLIPALDRTAGW
jgi:hypothetical protein